MRGGGERVSELQLHPFLNTALGGGEWLALRPSDFVLSPKKKSASPIYLEVEWVPESVRLLEEATNMLLLSETETQFFVCEVTIPLRYPGLRRAGSNCLDILTCSLWRETET
jgi:hypothetical protein